jgi:hypothetical protein
VTIPEFQATWNALEDFVTRYTYAPQNELATQWILDEFLAMGIDAEFHYYNQSGTRRNVIATIPGRVDPTKVVYLTAHLDATSPDPYTCAPGADDDGSGTAAVIEAARAMSEHLFEYTLKFACFNGEEQGLVGSGAYVADIAAAGEDVIGVFNMDMIAYRGSDPAPPDLYIYTDTGSQALAATLSDAVSLYTPGLLDPVVVVEAMGASDHASFWSYGYDAILAIEADVWGGDFCPWYHTCDDLVYRYPQDYVVNCAKANLAAAAVTAVPIAPDGPYIVLNSTTLDDDATGGSSGDGDGIANPGEVIELSVTLGNVGTAPATGLTGELSSASGDVDVLVGSSAWDDIPVGGSGTNLAPFLFQVAPGTPNGATLPFGLTVTGDDGSWDLAFQFIVEAPELAFYEHGFDDATEGDADGLVSPGETVRIPVSLINRGERDAIDVSAILSSSNGHVTILGNEAGADAIPGGEHRDLSPAYRIAIGSGAAVGEILRFDLAISASGVYVSGSGFKLKVGTRFYDDVEADGAWSLAAPGDDAATGRWVRVDPNGTTQNGEPCQPEDDHTILGVHCFVTGQGTVGGGSGIADVDNGTTTLTTPVFDLRNITDPRVTYWRWYTNDLGNNPGTDTWLVQVSNNAGGSWVDLERTQQSSNAWEERSFAIEDYVVPTQDVLFRFVASDLGDASLVEAAIDDFEIAGTMTPVGVGPADAAFALELRSPNPSPFSGATTIAFSLPARERATLAVFDLGGRLVRVLVDRPMGPGAHRVTWDGRDGAGRRAAPGVYFCRLETGERPLTRRLTLVY